MPEASTVSEVDNASPLVGFPDLDSPGDDPLLGVGLLEGACAVLSDFVQVLAF